MSDSLQPHGLYSPWNSPGQNTGVGSFSLFQGIVPTQGPNPGLQHCRWILYQLGLEGTLFLFISLYIMVQDLFCPLSLFPGPSLCSLWDELSLPSVISFINFTSTVNVQETLYRKTILISEILSKKGSNEFQKCDQWRNRGTNEGFLYRQNFT